MTPQLTRDIRYFKFVSRYAFDLVRFAVEVAGMNPTAQQVDLLYSVQDEGSRTTVRSGHGTGKTRASAVVAVWHLLCYIKSNTLITAPKIEQVQNVVWKEITDVVELIRMRGGHAWIADYIEIEAERIYIKNHKKTWFIIAKTAPRGSPENLAGMHRDWYLIIADEASGIPDPNFKVLTGALTDRRNRMLMLSQPTRPSGYFFDSHHKLSSVNGGVWTAIHMSSKDSPLVSYEFIEEKRVEYTDEEYVIKVLGDFPDVRDGYLLGRQAAEACVGRNVILDEAFGYVLSCDVGAGEYRDKSVALLAKVTGYSDYGPDARRVQIIAVPIFSNTRNIQNFSGEVFAIASELAYATTLVDAGGMGVAVCQYLEQNDLPEVKRIKWGNPCFKKRNKDRFFNLRAQAYVCAARAVKEGRLGISCDGPWKKELLDQMSRIPYGFDEKARYVIQRKEDMRRSGLPSPDLWDAIAQLFEESVVCMINEQSENSENSDKARLLAEAAKLFSDL